MMYLLGGYIWLFIQRPFEYWTMLGDLHVELVYGRWFGFWKDNLNNIECAIAAVSVIVLMVLLSVARTHWRKFPFPAFIAGSFPVLVRMLQHHS